jgi:hypothetical protein
LDDLAPNIPARFDLLEQRPDLAQIWAGSDTGEEDAGWSRHVDEAARTLNAIRNDERRLGPPPDDLFDVLSLAASAGPATAALRSYARAGASDPAHCVSLRDPAARSGQPFCPSSTTPR